MQKNKEIYLHHPGSRQVTTPVISSSEEDSSPKIRIQNLDAAS